MKYILIMLHKHMYSEDWGRTINYYGCELIKMFDQAFIISLYSLCIELLQWCMHAFLLLEYCLFFNTSHFYHKVKSSHQPHYWEI